MHYYKYFLLFLLCVLHEQNFLAGESIDPVTSVLFFEAKTKKIYSTAPEYALGRGVYRHISSCKRGINFHVALCAFVFKSGETKYIDIFTLPKLNDGYVYVLSAFPKHVLDNPILDIRLPLYK